MLRSAPASRWTFGCVCLLAACRAAPVGTGPTGEGPSAVETADLPAISLRDDTPNLLLTWVAEDGDFRVAERIDAVPEASRERVRVVLTDRAEGRGSTVYVADLRSRAADGSYAVSTLSRSEWEKLGAERRKVRIEALAPAPEPPEPPAQDTAAEGALKGVALPGAVSAIIYGADWCKPCHEAERYLKSLGVTVTKKDIEESRAAQAEMQEKLMRVNRSGAGIPVIDVMGKIFVGYSPGSLKQAVDAAKQAAAAKHG